MNLRTPFLKNTLVAPAIVSGYRGCLHGGELALLSGLAGLGEIIFIPRSHGIFYLRSVKKLVMSLEKDHLIKYFLQ